MRPAAAAIPFFLALAASAASHPAGNLAEALAARRFEWTPYALAAIESVRSLDEDGSGTPQLWRIAASSGAVQIRLRIQEGLDDTQARRKTESEITRVNMLYEGPAAYPGMITERNAVPRSLRPRKITAPAGASPVWLIPATSRLSYGAADEKDIAYESLLVFKRCPSSRRWARLEVFWPARQFNEAAALRKAAAFRCL
jgi:hypothetical protein